MTRFKQLTLAALAAALGTASITCGGGTTQPATPTAIAMASGDGQTGAVGSTLAHPLVVEVTDQSGNPVDGVSVAWDPQGSGSVSATTTKTGTDGRASVQRTLGGTAGAQTTTATVAGLQGSPVTFLATATTGGSGAGIVITTNPPTSALTGEVFDPSVQPQSWSRTPAGARPPGAVVTASALRQRDTGRPDHRDLGRERHRPVQRSRHQRHRHDDAPVHHRGRPA